MAVVCLAAALRQPFRAVLPTTVARLATLDSSELAGRRDQQRGLPVRILTPVIEALASRVQARWAGMSTDDLRRAGIDPQKLGVEELVALKVLAAAAAAAAVVTVATVAPGVIVLLPAASFLGFIAPSMVVRRRRNARRRQLLCELPDFVGLLKAFVTAGVTIEQALHLISQQQARGLQPNLLASEVRQALSDYGLGLPLDQALLAMAERVGIEELELLAAALSQGKRQGAAMAMILRDQETVVRLAQRNRATAEASRVGTRLVGILVLIYLPEFMVLIMVPLFYGIFLRAFS